MLEIHSFIRAVNLFVNSFAHSFVKYIPTGYSALVSVQVVCVVAAEVKRGKVNGKKSLHRLFNLHLFFLLTPENSRKCYLFLAPCSKPQPASEA